MSRVNSNSSPVPLSSLLSSTADSWGLSNSGRTPFSDPGEYVVDDLRRKGVDLKGRQVGDKDTMPSEIMGLAKNVASAIVDGDRRMDKSVKIKRTNEGVLGLGEKIKGRKGGKGKVTMMTTHVQKAKIYAKNRYPAKDFTPSAAYPAVVLALSSKFLSPSLPVSSSSSVIFCLTYLLLTILNDDGYTAVTTMAANGAAGFAVGVRTGGVVQGCIGAGVAEGGMRAFWSEVHRRYGEWKGAEKKGG